MWPPVIMKYNTSKIFWMASKYIREVMTKRFPTLSIDVNVD